MTTESAEAIKDWLLKATERDGNRLALRSAYIVTVRGRKVIATASGYTAHFSWRLPSTLIEKAQEVNNIRIVDLGLGLNLKAVRDWPTAESAFAFLVETFDFVTPIRVKTTDFLHVIEHIHKMGKRPSSIETAVAKLEFQEMRLCVSCKEPSIAQPILTEFDLMPKPFTMHVQSGYLLDAASIFRPERWLNLHIKSDPNMLAMGTTGDKLAVIMGMRVDEDEEQKDAVRW
ncbi:MAG: hypothetical protein K8L97_13995 [Anaerolineae bacterium]|nr:hypothetical protein [Anaerolineae bacterium]